MQRLDLEDMQGIVARGYGNLRAACYILLEIVNPQAAASWLGYLADSLTTSAARPEEGALNLALTPAGLRKFGLPQATLEMFSDEFTSGMTTSHRKRILGDVGDSAPERWLWGGPGSSLDIILMVFTENESLLTSAYNALFGQFTIGGVRQVRRLDTSDLDGVEPFGFRDGISQPIIEGFSRTGEPANTLKAGEFVLGYLNEYGKHAARPMIERSLDPQRILPDDPEGSGLADLGKNGTYLVIRQLRQDVHGFWRFMDEATKTATGASDPEARLRLAAKMVGRWPSGAPLVLAPEHDDPNLADANDFGYHHADLQGLFCPVGAHIRRSNPRDSLDPDPGSERSIAVNKRHRLLRRGREYGPALASNEPWQIGEPPHAAESGVASGDYERHAAQTAHAARTAEAAALPESENDQERGLHFICLNTNIARQFEFVNATWLNNPHFAGLYDDPDPLLALHGRGANFTIPGDPVRARVTGLPQFVTVRGGGYFFLPGIRALRYLSTLRKEG